MPELEEDYLVQIVRNGQNREKPGTGYSYQVPDHATILKTTNVKHATYKKIPFGQASFVNLRSEILLSPRYGQLCLNSPSRYLRLNRNFEGV